MSVSLNTLQPAAAPESGASGSSSPSQSSAGFGLMLGQMLPQANGQNLPAGRLANSGALQGASAYGVSDVSSLDASLMQRVGPPTSAELAQIVGLANGGTEMSVGLGSLTGLDSLDELTDDDLQMDLSEQDGAVLLSLVVGQLPVAGQIASQKPVLQEKSGNAIGLANGLAVDGSGESGIGAEMKNQGKLTDAIFDEAMDASNKQSIETPMDTAMDTAADLDLSSPGSQNQARGSSQTPAAVMAGSAWSAATESAGSAEDFSGQIDDHLMDLTGLDKDLAADEALDFGTDRQRWGSALGGRILTMVAADVQEARIHLDPPELGSLEIQLKVDQQDQVRVQIQAQNAVVRDVLESQAQKLRDNLEQQGFSLAGFDVSADGKGSDQQHANSNDDGVGGGNVNGVNDPGSAEASALSDEQTETLVRSSTHQGLVSTFA